MFVDTLFPSGNLRLIHGFQKSIGAQTTIVGNSQIEYRIQKMANYRSQWKWPSRELSAVDRRAIALFYSETARFGLNSFKFKDPDLYTYSNTALTYTGSANKFYLTTPGSSHPVFHLGNDCIVSVSGVPTAFTKSIVGGVPVITVAGATSSVTISGTFYHAARFDQADIGWTLEGLDSNNGALIDSLGEIRLIEVFEY